MTSEEIMQKLEAHELEIGNVNIHKQQVKKVHQKRKDKMHIVYIMAWTKTCGGSKIILEYANRLAERGHEITIVTYDAKPDWFSLDERVRFNQVAEGELLEDNIPDCDLVIATSWKCISIGLKCNKAPVIFFEQGGSHIFDVDNLSEEKKQAVACRIQVVPFIYTVSKYAQEKIKEIYKRDSEVMYNAIDENIFFVGESQEKEKNEIDITIIGSEEFKFKNIDAILEAIRILKRKYPIHLNWISQTEPKKNKEKAIVNPPQIEIGNILRKTDIYICNSEYESFGLPTLEAMRCGAAVITSDTGGMRDFVKDKINALVIKKNDINDIVEKVSILIESPNDRRKLVEEGINTAKRFSWKNSIDAIEEYYKELCNYKVDTLY